MLARLVSGLIGGAIVIQAARIVGLIGEGQFAIARAIWFALIAFLLVEGFTSGLFSAKRREWRLASVHEDVGRAAARLLMLIVVVMGLTSVLSEILAAAGGGEAGLTIVRGVGAILAGVLIFLLCRRTLWREPTTDEELSKDASDDNVKLWRLLRRAGRLLAGLLVLAPIIGYAPLAHFMASRFYLLAIIAAVAWFARAIIREGITFADAKFFGAEEAVKSDSDDEEHGFWAKFVVDVLLIIVSIPILLMLAGFERDTVSAYVEQAFLGFRVGGVVVSISDLLTAVAMFFALMGLTRLVQAGLKRGPLAHSRVDVGVANSLTTLIGYAGLVIAFFAGVSTLGFSLSNLAIIAGALSVGIGFGLQSIVNNFVSGLILLFERPIKAGDWIVTASGEGIVKKISVRSTEIETFDRASIIVPNSELISSTVTNWTHKNRTGRITVPVGVSYDADPEMVKEILLSVARDHPKILSYPEAFVLWQDFGASSLDFELRGYLANVGEGLSVRTELRFMIFKALAQAGIEIPFPRRDIHIKSGALTDPAPQAEAAQ